MPPGLESESLAQEALAIFLYTASSIKTLRHNRLYQIVARTTLGFLVIVEMDDRLLVTISCDGGVNATDILVPLMREISSRGHIESKMPTSISTYEAKIEAKSAVLPAWALNVETYLARARGTLNSIDELPLEPAQKERLLKGLKPQLEDFLDWSEKGDVTKWESQKVHYMLSEITALMFVIDAKEAQTDWVGACLDVAENCLSCEERANFLGRLSLTVPAQYLPKCQRLLCAIEENTRTTRRQNEENTTATRSDSGCFGANSAPSMDFSYLKLLACQMSNSAPDEAFHYFDLAADSAAADFMLPTTVGAPGQAVQQFIELAQAVAKYMFSETRALAYLRTAEEMIARITNSDVPGPDGFDISKAKGGDIVLGISLMLEVGWSLIEIDPTRAATIFKTCALAASQLRRLLVWRINLTLWALAGLAKIDKELAEVMLQEALDRERQLPARSDRVLAIAKIGAGIGRLDIERGRSLFNESVEMARVEPDAKKRVQNFSEVVAEADKFDTELADALRAEQLIDSKCNGVPIKGRFYYEDDPPFRRTIPRVSGEKMTNRPQRKIQGMGPPRLMDCPKCKGFMERLLGCAYERQPGVEYLRTEYRCTLEDIWLTVDVPFTTTAKPPKRNTEGVEAPVSMECPNCKHKGTMEKLRTFTYQRQSGSDYERTEYGCMREDVWLTVDLPLSTGTDQAEAI